MFQQHVQTLYNIRTIRSYPPNIVSSNVFSCNAFLATVPTVALVFHLSPRYLYIIVDGDAIVHEWYTYLLRHYIDCNYIGVTEDADGIVQGLDCFLCTEIVKYYIDIPYVHQILWHQWRSIPVYVCPGSSTISLNRHVSESSSSSPVCNWSGCIQYMHPC